jgi:hypothetical protein
MRYEFEDRRLLSHLNTQAWAKSSLSSPLDFFKSSMSCVTPTRANEVHQIYRRLIQIPVSPANTLRATPR